MSRHRNVRSMNYKDEYDGYDDVYGHSVEDDCISPSDAAQWLYDRARGTQHGIDSYLNADKDIPEEDEEPVDNPPRKESISLPELSPFDKARLDSCLEAIRNVMGETVPELILAEIIIKHDFDITRSLDAALTNKIETRVEDHSSKPDLKSKTNNFKKPMSLKDLMNSSSRQSNLYNRNVFGNTSSQKESLVTAIQKPESTKFTSLAELTSFHLNSANSESKVIKFRIPKFQLSNGLKDCDSNSNKQKNTELENWHIDLSSALRSVSSGNKTKSKPDQNTEQIEEFVPQFVDCEMDEVESLSVEIPSTSMSCLSDILNADVRHLKKSATGFGRILCRTYSPCFLPDISHNFDIEQELEPFKFDIPSPDDRIKQFIRK